MGRLIAIEGIDGAGKRTLVDGLATELEHRGHSVARAAFPRYSSNIHAALVGEALRGSHGDLAQSVYGMALLYALDRRDAAEELRAQLRANDIVLLDRYVASNAAYGSARLCQDAHGEFAAWVHDLEAERFAVPRPDLQVLFLVPAAVAASRAEHRERTTNDRSRDLFETDRSLQERCGQVYRQLAESTWWSPWLVIDGTQNTEFPSLAAAILRKSAQ